jgi:virginiamycin A acetyltransferase
MITPDILYPLGNIKDLIFLKHFISNPDIQIGDYTYYFDAYPEKFEKENVMLLFSCKLIIGKFGQIAQGTKFIMSGANHQMNGFSTYPFNIFGGDWANYEPQYPIKGDTVVGNDVWFGYNSVIMPGVKIGNGAIIGACSVVTKDVPAYTIVGGNPAKVIRPRFTSEVINALEEIKWWDWDHQKITRNLTIIISNDINKLRAAR